MVKQVENKEQNVRFECKEKINSKSVRKKISRICASPDSLCTFFHPALCLGPDLHGVCQWILHLLASCWVQPMQIPSKTSPLEVHLGCCVRRSKVTASFQLTHSIGISFRITETTPSLHPFRPTGVKRLRVLSVLLFLVLDYHIIPCGSPIHFHCPNLNK